MANEIRIQPLQEFLVRGSSMTVPANIVLERAIKVRGIHAKFHGAEETKAEYTTTSTDSKGVTTTDTHTAIQHTDITVQERLLRGNEKLGFFGNLSDSVATAFGGGKSETLPPGEHKFDIDVSIPADAPPTHQGNKTRVFYELSIHVDIPLGFDLKASKSFQVAPLPADDLEPTPVRIRYPADEGLGYFESFLSPDVQVEMALVANRFRPGDTIDGIFVVESKQEKSLNCSAIRARLVGIEKSQAHGHSDQYLHQSEPIELSRPGVLSGSYKQEFSLPATAAGPVTAKGKLFSIDWFVQIELDVPWAKDPTVRAPIVLLPAT